MRRGEEGRGVRGGGGGMREVVRGMWREEEEGGVKRECFAGERERVGRGGERDGRGDERGGPNATPATPNLDTQHPFSADGIQTR